MRRILASYATGAETIRAAAVGLQFLASYLGAGGSLRVLDGDDGGFDDLDASLLYEYWSVRCFVQDYETDTSAWKYPRVNMDVVARCWMQAAALGTQSVLDWLSERVRRIDSTGEEHGISGKDMNPLCTLMAHFVTGRDPEALARSGWAPITAYRAVAQRSLRSGDYEALATYHSKRLHEDFSGHPSSVVPFELLAIERLTGVPIENPKHEWLRTPLVRRRQVPEIPVPPELAAVIERSRRNDP
ncbi:MAG: hypothetical protein KIT31_01080 [Deltaproteobacteria bacterium]|nr:hypothetical protein [Deltaproteobacteria bacterium]